MSRSGRTQCWEDRCSTFGIVMPGMDGFEVLRRRQESGVFQKIPVIVLTMSDRKEDQELAEQLGADGFLLKPVDAKQARLQISRVLRED